MVQSRHNIQDLYEFLKFDFSIHNAYKNNDILFKEAIKSAPFWATYTHYTKSSSQDTHSLLLYNKGNHDLFQKLFKQYYEEHHKIEDKPTGNLDWIIPFSDPVDKLLGGFMSSRYFVENIKEQIAEDSAKGVNFYSLIAKHLKDVATKTLDFAYEEYEDGHMVPLSIVLELGLKDRPQFFVSKLRGLNLETRSQIYTLVYSNFVAKNPEHTASIFAQAVGSRTPYNDSLHYYVKMFKYRYPGLINQLINGPLLNEYKLCNYFVHEQEMRKDFYGSF